MVPEIPLGRWVADLVDFLRDNLAFLFDAITWTISGLVSGLQWAFNFPPSLVTIALFILLAFWLRGAPFALYTLLAFLLIDSVGMWQATMDTLALVLIATLFAVAIGVPVGILAARNALVHAIVRPILDFMQTLPVFIYLLPAIMFFGIGTVPGAVATLVFAMPPAVRLTNLGIRQVDAEVVEAAHAFGATPNQILFRVQFPLALPTIMAGINQVIMLALSMVVIAGMAGAGGLGSQVVRSVSTVNIGLGAESGISVVILAIFLDRVSEALSTRGQPPA
ncbi:MAG: proline/glycine betaine ABC transporter permease [Sphaerobacteraceae bacterium]|nr:MAG: proline/glycine betaine ABC transporter permease [Sphaerobacteraceae bacterium]